MRSEEEPRRTGRLMSVFPKTDDEGQEGTTRHYSTVVRHSREGTKGQNSTGNGMNGGEIDYGP